LSFKIADDSAIRGGSAALDCIPFTRNPLPYLALRLMTLTANRHHCPLMFSTQETGSFQSINSDIRQMRNWFSRTRMPPGALFTRTYQGNCLGENTKNQLVPWWWLANYAGARIRFLIFDRISTESVRNGKISDEIVTQIWFYL
jgi:hypothetical protein